MTAMQIGLERYEEGCAELAVALADAYARKVRPFCCCVSTGIEMYIAKLGSGLCVKRMPNTGGRHDPSCGHYEAPAELSGIGQVIGSAIREDPETGSTALRLGFAMSRRSGRAPSTSEDGEQDSVRAERARLTLRGMLHYLWEQAGFNRWAPGMEGKRSWYVVRKYLLQAADAASANGASLRDLVYVPEPFNAERKGEMAQRRAAMFAAMCAGHERSRSLKLLIAEVKEISSCRFGHKIVFKHLADCPFMMAEDLHRRLTRRFAVELALWSGLETSRLVAAATFGVGPTGLPSLEEVAFMNASESWVPFESGYEHVVLSALTNQRRRFVKGMRYNLPSSAPLASFVLLDTPATPVCLYVDPPGAMPDYTAKLLSLAQDSALPYWVWRAGEDEMPTLPGA